MARRKSIPRYVGGVITFAVALLAVAATVRAPGASPASPSYIRAADSECGFFGGPWGPATAAYDPGRGEVFIADSETNHVYVLSAADDRIVANISFGALCVNPFGVVYDPLTHQILVSEIGGGGVALISDRTNNVTGFVNLTGGGPMFIALDTGQNEVFSTDVNGNISVPSLTTGSTVATISSDKSGQPLSIAYSPALGDLFVANNGGQTATISEISGTSDSVVATLSVNCNGPPPGGSLELPLGILYDPDNGLVYTSFNLCGSLSEVDGTSGTQVGTLPLGGLSFGGALTYDNVTGTIWVSGWTQDILVGVSASNGQVVAQTPLPSEPGLGIAVDPSSGDVFVPLFKNQSVAIVAPDGDLVAVVPLPVAPTPGPPAPLPTYVVVLAILVPIAVIVAIWAVVVDVRRRESKYLQLSAWAPRSQENARPDRQAPPGPPSGPR